MPIRRFITLLVIFIWGFFWVNVRSNARRVPLRVLWGIIHDVFVELFIDWSQKIWYFAVSFVFFGNRRSIVIRACVVHKRIPLFRSSTVIGGRFSVIFFNNVSVAVLLFEIYFPWDARFPPISSIFQIFYFRNLRSFKIRRLAWVLSLASSHSTLLKSN